MRALLLLSTLGLAVCGQPQPFDPEIEVAPGEPFVLRLEQTAAVVGTPLHIRFDEVPEDSRCPSDVVCVWAGNARVRLVVSMARESGAPIDLNTGLDPRSASIHNYAITLEEVQPAPTSTASIPPADYLARLRVSHTP